MPKLFLLFLVSILINFTGCNPTGRKWKDNYTNAKLSIVNVQEIKDNYLIDQNDTRIEKQSIYWSMSYEWNMENIVHLTEIEKNMNYTNIKRILIKVDTNTINTANLTFAIGHLSFFDKNITTKNSYQMIDLQGTTFYKNLDKKHAYFFISPEQLKDANLTNQEGKVSKDLRIFSTFLFGTTKKLTDKNSALIPKTTINQMIEMCE